MLITSKRDEGQALENQNASSLSIFFFFLLIWVFHPGFNKTLNGGRWNNDEIDSESNQALCLLIYPQMYFLVAAALFIRYFLHFLGSFLSILKECASFCALCVCLQIESWQYFSVAVSPCLHAFCVLCYVFIFYIPSYFDLFICNDASWVQAWAQIVCAMIRWALNLGLLMQFWRDLSTVNHWMGTERSVYINVSQSSSSYLWIHLHAGKDLTSSEH